MPNRPATRKRTVPPFRRSALSGAASRLTVSTSVAAAILAASPLAAAPLSPEPTSPEPEVIRPDGESPVYYRLPDDRVLVGYETGLGLGFDPGGDRPPGFAFSAAVGARVSPRRDWRAGAFLQGGLLVDAGAGAAGAAGLGFVWRRPGPTLRSPFRTEDTTLTILPQAVLAGRDGGAAWGFRSSLTLTFWLYGLTVGHQVLWVGGEEVHQVQILFSSAWYGRWRR